MPNKIPEEVKTKIRELYSKGFRISEIVGHTGISYTSVYGLTRLRERINPETGNPFQSRSEYDNYRLKQRSEREYNKFLKNFINKRLKDLGKKQSWLAREMHLTRSAIHNYVKGITLPNKNNLGKLLSILQEAPKTLEDLTS